MKRLRQWREENKVTQLALANAIGMKPSMISLLESGDREASFSTLIAISHYTLLTIDELLDHTPGVHQKRKRTAA